MLKMKFEEDTSIFTMATKATWGHYYYTQTGRVKLLIFIWKEEDFVFDPNSEQSFDDYRSVCYFRSKFIKPFIPLSKKKSRKTNIKNRIWRGDSKLQIFFISEIPFHENSPILYSTLKSRFTLRILPVIFKGISNHSHTYTSLIEVYIKKKKNQLSNIIIKKKKCRYP